MNFIGWSDGKKRKKHEFGFYGVFVMNDEFIIFDGFGCFRCFGGFMRFLEGFRGF